MTPATNESARADQRTKIFISYRRSDAKGTAGRVRDHLVKEFGEEHVFLDTEDIEDGEEYPTRLRSELESASVVIVLIGTMWLGALDRYSRRRIDLPRDFVRREVLFALKTTGVHVLPVLIDGASLPEPEAFEPHSSEIAALLRRSAFGLRSESFTRDLEALVESIARFIPRLPAVPLPASRQDGADQDTQLLEQWRADYLETAQAECRFLPMVGFASPLRVPIRLEDLYVTLRAIPDRAGASSMPFADAADAKTRLASDLQLRNQTSYSDIKLIDAFKQPMGDARYRGFVLLGDPGSGKTTHLKRLVLWIADGHADVVGLPQDTLPILIPLRDVRVSYTNWQEFLRGQLRQQFSHLPFEFGYALLSHRKLLLLFDGLDEIPDAHRRQEVAGWIENAHNQHPQARVVVSCRYAGYRPPLRFKSEFLELHLRPLSPEDATAFIQKWYRIVELHRDPSRDSAICEAEAKSKADDLWNRLSTSDYRSARVVELSRNPLLLTAMCLLHRDRGELPRERHKLFEDCVQLLLSLWRESRGICLPFDASQTRRALQQIAFWLHQENQRTRATLGDLANQIKGSLPHSASRRQISAEEFLTTVRDVSGLLTGWGDESYGFMHLGFQEYLVACEIRDRYRRKKSLGGLVAIARKFNDSWWQEVILLLAALPDPPMFGPLSREIVRRQEFAHAGDLLDKCVEDAGKAPDVNAFIELILGRSSSLYRRITSVLTDRTDDMLDRQKAAFELLRRHFPDRVQELKDQLLERASTEFRDFVESRLDLRRDLQLVEAERGGYLMVRIPGGTATMGSPVDEDGRFDREGPQYLATLPNFSLGVYPVTNAEYERFLRENSHAREPAEWANRSLNAPRQPVVGVSWHEAMAYCEWAGLMLPTEAQWEYAARAGTQSRYWSGNDIGDLDRVGWYDQNSSRSTQRVGQKPPNAFGLFDVHGNVWEWCLDHYEPHAHMNLARKSMTIEETLEAAKQTSKQDRSMRVLRGGSWNFPARSCRSAYRSGHSAVVRDSDIGFRAASPCLRVLPPFGAGMFVKRPENNDLVSGAQKS